MCQNLLLQVTGWTRSQHSEQSLRTASQRGWTSEAQVTSQTEVVREEAGMGIVVRLICSHFMDGEMKSFTAGTQPSSGAAGICTHLAESHRQGVEDRELKEAEGGSSMGRAVWREGERGSLTQLCWRGRRK